MLNDVARLTLMQLWRLHKAECRPIGSIVADARSGALPGVKPLESGFGFAVVDTDAAFAAMKKLPPHLPADRNIFLCRT